MISELPSWNLEEPLKKKKDRRSEFQLSRCMSGAVLAEMTSHYPSRGEQRESPTTGR